ncbi:hypothetical protein CAP35_13280 [Chitinophagaceae bacterium IBVUCB1]|nr:hypothetical protein CAP35_13280 [Chitinophagaceae bacterium IBVUCB1]
MATTTAHAQWLTKRKENGKLPVRYFLNIGAQYHFNQPDLAAFNNGDLSIRNSIGLYTAFNLQLLPNKAERFFNDLALVVCVVPQRFTYTQQPGRYGHNTNETIRASYGRNTAALGVRYAPGYSFYIGKRTALDVTAGMMVDIALNAGNQYTTQGVYARDTLTGYNVMPAYINTGFAEDANSTIYPDGTSISLSADAQVAMRRRDVPLLWRKRDARIGLGFTRLIVSNNMYTVRATRYNTQRVAATSDALYDKNISLMLFAGITL